MTLAAALGRFPTATLFEAAGKTGDMSPRIRAMVPGARMAGVARTLKIWPGDTLGVLRLIDSARPGDVLVIAGGVERAAVWGGTSTLACRVRGVAGCVTDGCIRDLDGIVAEKFPVFAAGVSPRGTTKNHPGWPGIPVSIGDCVIAEGDIVVGDSDGVLVVPASRAADVLLRAQAQAQQETARDERVRAGESLAAVLGFSA
jgi:4-hydroxy-4-methyl-2-oxoglutarate aldolase